MQSISQLFVLFLHLYLYLDSFVIGDSYTPQQADFPPGCFKSLAYQTSSPSRQIVLCFICAKGTFWLLVCGAAPKECC